MTVVTAVKNESVAKTLKDVVIHNPILIHPSANQKPHETGTPKNQPQRRSHKDQTQNKRSPLEQIPQRTKKQQSPGIPRLKQRRDDRHLQITNTEFLRKLVQNRMIVIQISYLSQKKTTSALSSKAPYECVQTVKQAANPKRKFNGIEKGGG